ncbi:MAG: DUF342 domain-containing protein, partial [bacterium]|nr:DUF342 domain-containing protein [bacterium]
MPEVQEEFDLRVTDDRLAVLLDCTVEGDRFDKVAERVEGALRGLSVAVVPERAQLTQRLIATCVEDEQGKAIRGLKVIEGTPPTQPRHGKVIWAGDFFSSGFVIDEETGTIDYREKKAQPAVEKGQLLAHLIPRKEGHDGLDVFGKRVPAPRAQPVRLRAAGGVELDEEENTCTAAQDGRVRYIDNMLTVDQIYSVDGSVGLGTGNITHPGALIIEEDIETGVRVKADGDISVGGIIESADLETGGDLDVRGGITGRLQNPIRAAGHVQARFILEAEVSAGQDIMVANEIIHSKLRSQSAVCMPHGRLVGGETYARRLIDVKQAGSDGIIPTMLVVGVLGEMAQVVAEKEKQMETLKESARKIRATVNPLVSQERALSHSKREIVTQLMDK